MVSSESTICNVISVQSLSRSVRQYLWLSDRFLAYFRTGSIISLCIYLVTDGLTIYFYRGFNFNS
ncbi:hypothetical protein BDR07DRAFT_1434544 [Suillus spraguei]|nr:hypothetical protein BDR07DRAFT_1434544 [Suillus spraguei]